MTTTFLRYRIGQFCVAVLIATATLMSTYVATSPPAVRANGAPVVQPLYEVYVDRPHLGSVSSSAMVFTGRESWTNVTVSAGVPAVPLFAVGTDAKVPAQSSIVITGLSGVSVSAVRAALDGVNPEGDGCRGGSDVEKAAIRGYYWDGDSWESGGATAASGRGASCGPGNNVAETYWSMPQTNPKFDKAMFVVDLHCGSADCSTRNGNPAGGTSMIIEVEGSGDGVFNSGKDGANDPNRGDEAFEIVLGTQGIKYLPMGPPMSGIASDVTEFLGTTLSATAFSRDPNTGIGTVTTSAAHGLNLDDIVGRIPGCSQQFSVAATVSATSFEVDDMRCDPVAGPAEIASLGTVVGLESVPACSGLGDAGPCLATVSAGWGVSLIDSGFASLDLRPYKTLVTTSAQPLVVVSGDRVEFALRIPNGPFRAYDLGSTIAAGMSIAASSSFIDSYTYTEGATYSTVTFAMEARETTKVFTYGETSSGELTGPGQPAGIFFQDDCTGKITVGSGQVSGSTGCENQSGAFDIDQVVLIGDEGGSDDRAWMRAEGHNFQVNDKVTVCCVYGAFDGHQEIVAVGNPLSIPGDDSDWFAFSTSASSTYNDLSFPDGNGDSLPDPDIRFGQVVAGYKLRVAVTSVSIGVTLSKLEFEEDAARAGSFLSTNAQAFAFGDQMFDPTDPAFDFGLAGPSERADGTSRATDGFFRACVPGGYVDELWDLTVASAATRINGSQASSAANRNGGLVATEVSCGAASGVLVSLNQFGYSAPYFAIKPAPVADASPTPLPGGGGSSTPGGPLPGVPRSLAGSDRVATALAIVEEDFAPISQTSAQSTDLASQSTRTAGAAVIVSSTSFADSLTAGPLAMAKNAPLFLTGGSSLDSRVASALTRFVPKNKTVYVVGGESAVSSSVSNRLQGLGYTVVRLAGSDRYATSVAVARDGIGTTTTLVAATGLDYPDGLAAGVVTARLGGAIVLTRGSQVPEVVQSFVNSSAATTLIAVGGPASTAFPNATKKLQGSDRYSTAAAVASAYPPTGSLVGAASGEVFADGLASIPYLARRNSVLLLVRQTTVPSATNNFLTNRPSVKTVQVFGGTSIVSDVTRRVLSGIVS